MLQLRPYTETFPVPCTDALFMHLVEQVGGWKPDDKELYIQAHHEKWTKNTLFS